MLTREFLRTVDLFAPLVDRDADALISIGREEIFQKGQAIFREKDAGGKLYLVMSGVVEVAKASTPSSQPTTLARLGRGEIVGEIAAFDGGPRSANATAAVVAETRLFAWDMVEFNRYLSGRPQAALIILSGLLKKLGGRLRKTSEAVQTLVRAL
jgi:CRP/FNR family cyclic AMP-dependent transcriptional regulator